MSNLPLYRDPWAKLDAWRKSPVFQKTTVLRNLFPGFGIAVVAFTAYVIADNVYLSAHKKVEEKHH
ncbi:NADH dehydrogenase 1 beta subcomplex subunit 3 [Lentinula edodes]|uniref:NADH dehydrogenase 1 beta subcomplex subunit 3 n=1 Tax=Lentinula lateritia TaxID=40482 RepID=A0A9W9DG70_9AGAR|nr:NADH dehydrogenase 1 beta subcomplex subunit 3 [Lentinula edodes]KAH7874772.1 NADH dehydrogenase 1 beta subcomplex subunit 3 [Lentinula edodes]KAJ3874940.1 NADH dehydrogenase 1 beta subcomplex subunit 3 [Lentinula edodes]KAJ3896894.1 NADH dehydrogenase 1 beta subcomplex subunit 3 [Lentinula edodes]KAJ3900697.1 NADH dehydrogenase 1 beta subcomplex subunit 3 [Lentinula edodes]KAJ3919429.1 NADH dehydrogenase 1 beta subcomplex subunit 3 [Lentinula edodes]